MKDMANAPQLVNPLVWNLCPMSQFLTMDNLNGIRQPSVDEFCCNVEQRLPSNWNCCLIKHWANCICLSISSLWIIIICLSLSYKTQRSNFVQIVGNWSSTLAVEYRWSMITIGYDGFTAAVIVWGLENAWLSTLGHHIESARTAVILALGRWASCIDMM